jgi:hypothetical protein
MDSNTHSTEQPTGESASQWTSSSAGPTDELAALTAVIDQLAARDLMGLPDAVRAGRVRELRRLLDRLEGRWLAELASVDACGAAGAEDGVQAASTASWLRARLRLGAGAASSTGPDRPGGVPRPFDPDRHGPDRWRDLPGPRQRAGPRHPRPPRPHRRRGRTGAGGGGPPAGSAAAAAGVRHLRLVADPKGAEATAEQRHARRGRWLPPTFEGMVAIDALLEPEASQIVLAALEPLARPASADDTRSGGQRRADALTELARRSLEGGGCPRPVRSQLLVTVDLASLLDPHGGLGGEAGWAGPLAPETCRRLACDGALTRVLVSRHPTDQDAPHHHDLSEEDGQRRGYGRRWPCSPPAWVGPPASPWTWAGPPGSSPPANATPWPSATAAAWSPTAPGPWPGGRPSIGGTGWTAAPPTWPTWSCCAASIIGRSTRAAGG